MRKREVLELLKTGEYISGEEIGRTLGISRVAVCKIIGKLREEGCQITATPNRGYCLQLQPLRQSGLDQLLPDCPWRVTVLEQVDSTNNALKRDCEAAHGTVLVTGLQTGGRGRRGKVFSSPRGGVYLSVLLRPQAEADQLLHITPMAALAVRRAIADCCGIPVGIKWINDLVYEGKKLCGILTELTTEAGSGHLQSVIIGIGVNCNTEIEKLPEEVQPMATSLRQLMGKPVDPNVLAAAMVRRLMEMDQGLLKEKEAWLREYEAACVTVGQRVQVITGDSRRPATATGIDENGGLCVRWDNGETAVISTGEVSVRGMYGYV